MEQFTYIVTLKSKDDLQAFYNDMEFECNHSCVPAREVECCNRRPISRNTEYLLTKQEAEQLRSDPRVLAVERIPEEIGILPSPSFIQTETTWDKSNTNNINDKNWALLRCTLPEQISGWGADASPPDRAQSGTIQVNAEGRNVDVVIVDGMINPNHPEYAVNSDGTGGSRVIQFNWYQFNLGQASSTYVYEPYDDGDTTRTENNNHGAHVAGTVVGSTQGWARKANIYNINPYGSDINQTSSTLLFDFIREFHNNKPINPNTGRRNPTICNNSWGFAFRPAIEDINFVNFRGQSQSGPFTEQQLNDFGINTRTINGTVFAEISARVTAVDADVQDAINDGIVIVGAAGNNSTKIDVPGGIDFNNSLTVTFSSINYHRGSTPASSGTGICVGAINALATEAKATFSNCGPRVNIYAPGQNIMSSVNSTTTFGGVDDPRDEDFKIVKISGTSMASPQVCGILACILEIYPNLTQQEAIEYIQFYAKKNQINDTGGGFTDNTSLQGSPNNFLFYFEERLSSGNIFPKFNSKVRPTTGSVYPRTRIRRQG